MSDYAAFLATKHPLATFVGPDVLAEDVHPMLHDWQNDLVRWAVKIGRAAIWADTGIQRKAAIDSGHANQSRARDLYLCTVRSLLRDVPQPHEAEGTREVLLEGVRRTSETHRVSTAMRHVRRGFLPSHVRAGRRREDQPVLLARVLHGLARLQHGAEHLRETRLSACAPDRRRGITRATAPARRSGPPQGRGQAQQPPLEPRSVPQSVGSSAVSYGRHV